jgi:hypothetical protein
LVIFSIPSHFGQDWQIHFISGYLILTHVAYNIAPPAISWWQMSPSNYE